MHLSDFYAVLITVSLLAGAIIVLRVFFTLWAPIDRRVNRDRLDIGKEIHIDSLKNKAVNIYLKSTTVLNGVVLLGYCSTHVETPYSFKQLLMVRLPDDRKAYIRIEEIEYLEEQTGPP